MSLIETTDLWKTYVVGSEEIHALLRRFMNHHDERQVLAELNRRLAERGLSAMTTAAALSYLPMLRSVTASRSFSADSALCARRCSSAMEMLSAKRSTCSMNCRVSRFSRRSLI